MRRQVLLNPGPVNVTDRVRNAAIQADICHREEEFTRLLDAIRDRLVRVFAPSGEHTAVVLSGSGTAALEAAVASTTDVGRSMLVVVNGVYGERIAKMAKIHGIPCVEVFAPWGEPPDLALIEKKLATERSIQTVAFVHHETTTGMINPVAEIAALARARGNVTLVDSISGLGGEKLDVEGLGLDVVVCTANKCLQGLPGASFVLARRSEMLRMAAIEPRTLYLHLPLLWEAEEKRHECPFTPAIPAFFALDAALEELAAETLAGRIARYRSRADTLRHGFERLGLRLLLRRELLSNTITSLHLPSGRSYPALHDRLKAAGFVIYAGQGALAERIFRIANMGAIGADDIHRFLGALEDALR